VSEVLAEVPPAAALSALVQKLKGRSSRLLRAEFAALKDGDERVRQTAAANLVLLSSPVAAPPPLAAVKGRSEPPLRSGSRSAFGRPLTAGGGGALGK